MDHNPSGRRPHYHRGRRGADRRGNDRRTSPPAPEQTARSSGDQVDVEQIMREIRTRISRHGIELSPQQIQDLAARRLEAILDPRTVSPTLIDQLRKGAAAAPEPLPVSPETDYSFNENAIYESERGLLTFLRRLLNPLLKLFFNPTPIVAALQTQARINRDAAVRAADAERRQAEWNALHYQILQRLVTEISRVSLEMQALSGRVESLAARVDFNDRRVRSFEATSGNRSQRSSEPAPTVSVHAETVAAGTDGAAAAATAAPPSADGPRRRRRRRRGRRGSIPGAELSVPASASIAGESPDDGTDVENGEDEESLVPEPAVAAEQVVHGESSSALSVPADSISPPPPPEPAPFSGMPQTAAASDETPADAPADAADEGPESADR